MDTPTILRSKAARFQSFADAKAFVEVNRIAFETVLTYIGLDDFTDLELKGSEAFNHLGRRGGHMMTIESGACATCEMETASISNTV